MHPRFPHPRSFEEYTHRAVFWASLLFRQHHGTLLGHLITQNMVWTPAHQQKCVQVSLLCFLEMQSALRFRFPPRWQERAFASNVSTGIHPGKLHVQLSWLFHVKCSHLRSAVLTDGDIFVISRGTNYRYPLLYGMQMGYPGTLPFPRSLCKKDLFP